MKLQNQFLTTPYVPTQWEETEDGFLRVQARVLAERVMPYLPQELSEIPTELADLEVVKMLVTSETMSTSDSLRTLEGAQVVAPDHIWVTPDNAGVSKGNTAGQARVDGPYLVIDLIVTDPITIEAIKKREIGEISAGYHADSVFENGEWEGQHYDAKQTQLRFNHIAIIPFGEGRAGADVRILNKKSQAKDNSKGGKNMGDVRIKLRNTGKYVNTDEEGASAIAEEEKTQAAGEGESSKKLEETMSELEGKNGELATLQAEIEELKGELSVYKEKLDTLLSEESIEHAAMGMIEDQGEANEIIENVIPDEEKKKEEIKNSIKSLHGVKLYSHILTNCGVNCEGMSPDGLKGAFKAQSQIIKNMKAKGVTGAHFMNNMTAKSTTASKVNNRSPKERLGFPVKEVK